MQRTKPLTEPRQQLRDVLKEEGPMRARNMAEHVGRPYGSVRWLLAEMAKDRQVIRLEKGLYGLREHRPARQNPTPEDRTTFYAVSPPMTDPRTEDGLRRVVADLRSAAERSETSYSDDLKDELRSSADRIEELLDAQTE
jgi:hypothetical protein